MSIHELEPRSVWKHFWALTQIPRPSKNEQAARAYVEAIAEPLHLPRRKDAYGNLLVSKPATAGRELQATCVLQAHLDMVCERDPESPRNPSTEPLLLAIQDGWVSAVGTTLGADNGLGVAVALAVMQDQTLPHGPLEFLFTVEEEIGLQGSANLDPKLFENLGKIERQLISLDGGAGSITVGCAGSILVDLTLPLRLEPVRQKFAAYGLRLGGLQGGHSGNDIHRHIANANKVLAAALEQVAHSVDCQWSGLQGGEQHNALPRNAEATIFCAANDLQAIEAILRRSIVSPAQFSLQPLPPKSLHEAPSMAISRKDADQLLQLLAVLPHGMLSPSQLRPGRPETSISLGIVRTYETQATVSLYGRSNHATALSSLLEVLQGLATLTGAKLLLRSRNPGWQPTLEGVLLNRAQALHQQLFNKAAELKVTHGCLECAHFADKLKALPMIAIGPQIENLHSPTERLQVDSVGSFYTFLQALLQMESS